ncbi:FLYWCH-type zinc finger-containing protein 1 [Frankliniella fusca]|uniref:FLYWCH-type zinc finger-containing protein 1 n=1 Tax=Frankliniella fusca TaxID=407009 RepID=A0AAE1L7E9_9NEOP|nr:FLYWCH-type zinc finger-containing protein 1 [Frankliniella fusca]
MSAEIVNNQLQLDGYIYYKVNSKNERTYWTCKRSKIKECKAKAITKSGPDGRIIVIKGSEDSPHGHPPNREEGEAAKIVRNIKRVARDHPGMPPAQILRAELSSVPSGVLSQLPERENLKKMMRRGRRTDLPKNPVRLSELRELPEKFTKTLLGENFVLFDSRTPESDEGEDGEEDEGDNRVIVFGTRRNLELLGKSGTWFVDGTFKTSPKIFVQVFTISALVKRQTASGREDSVCFPLVYALLSSKMEVQYSQVLQAVKTAAREQRVGFTQPSRVMSDFEVAILNAVKTAFPDATVSCCFFHLGQSIYRKVQSSGLQAAYNDLDDRETKIGVHMLLALAFVPPDDVKEVFRDLQRSLPHPLTPIVTYLKETYIMGTTNRRTRRLNPPRYPVSMWNQYGATLRGEHRTNNLSEGWHNRFRLVVGKHHPDLYSSLKELQKEQADTEAQLAEFSLGRRIRAAPKKKWLDQQHRVHTIVLQYEQYKEEDDVIGYLRSLAHTIVL